MRAHVGTPKNMCSAREMKRYIEACMDGMVGGRTDAYVEHSSQCMGKATQCMCKATAGYNIIMITI